ncbi:uncharacterized protein ACB058_001628 [Synchiropus picturatus]
MSELAETSVNVSDYVSNIGVKSDHELTLDLSGESSCWQVGRDSANRAAAQQEDSDSQACSQPPSDDSVESGASSFMKEDEEEKEGLASGGSDDEPLSYDQYLQLLQNLTEDVDSINIQPDFYENPDEENLDENLNDMKRQQAAELERIEQLSASQSMLQQKLEEVEREWQLFMTQIHDVAFEVASRRQGTKTEESSSSQLTEQELEAHLNQLCSRNTRLDTSIDLLETYIQEEQKRMKVSSFMEKKQDLADTSQPEHKDGDDSAGGETEQDQ